MAMDIYLPKKLENLTNKNLQLTQNLVKTQVKSMAKRTHQKSFLAKLNEFNSQENQQPTKKTEDLSSMFRLEVIIEKNVDVLNEHLLKINFSDCDKNDNLKKLVFLKIKVLVNFFQNVVSKFDTVLNDFKQCYFIQERDLETFDISDILMSKMIQ